LVFTYVLVQAIYRSAGLPMPSFTGLIKNFELNYGNVSDWLDYPSFYPKCQQPQAGAAILNLLPRSTVMRPRGAAAQAGDPGCRPVRGRGQYSEVISPF
jgi:hypothetical protein